MFVVLLLFYTKIRDYLYIHKKKIINLQNYLILNHVL